MDEVLLDAPGWIFWGTALLGCHFIVWVEDKHKKLKVGGVQAMNGSRSGRLLSPHPTPSGRVRMD